MAKIGLEIDASLVIAAYNAGLETGFILASDFNELDQTLNVNGIEEQQDGDLDL